ncbi:hypothetical protein GCM10023238_38590 [Streptomyces heliomycini]
MTLDAVVDPSAGTVGHAKNQTRGFQTALDNYLRSTGRDPEQGSREIAELLERIDSDPLPTSSSGRELTQTLALTGIVLPLYSKTSWPVLTSALEAAEEGDGTELLALADGYNERRASGRYGTTTHSQRVISCLDDKQRPTVERRRSCCPSSRRSPPCSGPSSAGTRPAGATTGRCPASSTPEVSAPGAAPVLVVGNTGDPATPYEGARKMADELGEDVGVVLTWKGEAMARTAAGATVSTPRWTRTC